MSTHEAELEKAKAAIEALNQLWEERFAHHDLAGLTALFTEDCMRMPQGAPASVGRLALEAAYRRDFAEVWQSGARVRLNMQEITISGEYAFGRGADTLIRDGSQSEATSKWVFVYRREAEGRWKFHWVMFNSDGPPPGLPQMPNCTAFRGGEAESE